MRNLRLCGVFTSVAAMAALLFVGVGSASAVSASSSLRTEVVANCARYRIEPTKIVVSCADDGIYLTAMRWRTWQHAHARGHGRLWINNCKPSCAGGHFHHYFVHVRLGKAVTAKGHHVFSVAHVHFGVRRPAHASDYTLLDLPTTPN